MKKVLKWVGIVLGSVIGLVVLAFIAVTIISNSRMNKEYTVAVEPLNISDDSESIARGEHVFFTRGCWDCHGNDLSGSVMEDDPVFGRLVAPNLTPGEGGIADLSDEDIIRAVRYGVRHDNTPLVIMPADAYNQSINDEDMANLIAFIRSAHAVDNDLPAMKFGPMFRVIHATGGFPVVPVEVIDLEAPPPAVIETAVTAEYGEYLAKICLACHGENLSGQETAFSEEPAPNLTPDNNTGLGSWTEADFFKAMREGLRPDGSTISSDMPWKAFGQMTDEELSAIWLYLQSLEPITFIPE